MTQEQRSFRLRVPASTANLGPGFDALGAALSLYLTLSVDPLETSSNAVALVQGPVLTYAGDNPQDISTDPDKNLITRIASMILSAHGRTFPSQIKIHIDNPIPLGRGLGSSGAAVVAGVLLANQACNLKLSDSDVLDYVSMIEGHPDNVSASFLGGVRASLTLDTSTHDRHSVFESLLDSKSKVSEMSLDKLEFVFNKTNSAIKKTTPWVRSVPIPTSPNIKAVVLIPKQTLPTSLSRSVLPAHYTRDLTVFNLQRIAVLCSSLASPDPEIIHEALKDQIHQPFRSKLVPGLSQILNMSPKDFPGLLGTCLSGAGPTVLALATDGFDKIGQAMLKILDESASSSTGADTVGDYRVLEIEHNGAQVLMN